MIMMIEKILSLKQEQDAVILAHNYQPGPIQEIANLVGDSLELSRAAAELKNKIIIFYFGQINTCKFPESIQGLRTLNS